MESWSDQAIIVNVKPHGEHGIVVFALTKDHGLYAGYMPGAMSKKNQGQHELGNLVSVEWQARLNEHLGRFRMELDMALSVNLLSHPQKLLALRSACALCRYSLPERESNPAQFQGLLALLQSLGDQTLPESIWPQAYIAWEIGFLNEQGCSLDLTKCAVTGEQDNLTFVSPKSGRAVSSQAAAPYQDKLLKLPHFLGGPIADDDDDIKNGLKLTGYFLSHHLFGQTTRPVPEERLQLFQSFDPALCDG